MIHTVACIWPLQVRTIAASINSIIGRVLCYVPPLGVKRRYEIVLILEPDAPTIAIGGLASELVRSKTQSFKARAGGGVVTIFVYIRLVRSIMSS